MVFLALILASESSACAAKPRVARTAARMRGANERWMRDVIMVWWRAVAAWEAERYCLHGNGAARGAAVVVPVFVNCALVRTLPSLTFP